MLVKVVLPAALICHCTVGVGFPLAAAVKLAFCPAVTNRLVGCAMIVGAVSARATVSVAGLLVTLLAMLLTTTVNWEPLSADVVAGVV